MDSNSHWSGWILPSVGKPFNSVIGQWHVPSTDPRFCAGSAFSSTWAGMDGYSSSDVVQAGTRQDSYNIPVLGGFLFSNHYAWFEWFPQQNEQAIVNFPVRPGDAIESYVFVSKNSAGFLMENETTHQSFYTFENAAAGIVFRGNVAELIVERPSINNQLPQLASFSGQSMYGFAGPTTSGFRDIANMDNSISMNMSNGSDTLATPTLPTNGNFNVFWARCN